MVDKVMMVRLVKKEEMDMDGLALEVLLVMVVKILIPVMVPPAAEVFTQMEDVGIVMVVLAVLVNHI